MDDKTLRRTIHRKFTTGELPTKPPAKMWGGRATGKTCAVCDLVIVGNAEIEAAGADA